MSAGRWEREKAQRWALDNPWWVGCNFIPSTASNQFEMWQVDTFDPATIARELNWASQIGMNCVRVFLHDLVWQADPEGCKSRIDRFLQIAESAGIQTMLVLFDDCWFPPRAGIQPEPTPGVHNSRWAQSPGHDVVQDRSQWPRLERYVRDIVETFGQDSRVCVWDLYNEPGNALLPAAALPTHRALPRAVGAIFRHFVLPSPTLPLLHACLSWVRAVDPMQPLTVGIWAPIPALNRFQLGCSDVVSFHHYGGAESLEKKITALQSRHQRPVLCTEWMARPLGSRVQSHLPVFHKTRVGCFCWGLVSGRTQTIHGWRDRPGTPPPAVWHHDLLHPDGTPYDSAEIELMRQCTESASHTDRAKSANA